MKYLIIPKSIIEEKLSHFEISMNKLKEYSSSSIAATFLGLIKLHYDDIKQLQNYTLIPPDFATQFCEDYDKEEK